MLMSATTTSERGAKRWAAPLAAALIVALPVAGLTAPATAGSAAAPAIPAKAVAVAAPAKAVALGDRTLRRGDRGKDVRSLQKLLSVKKTGYFNKRTGKAVRKVERKYDLKVDTVVDAKTLKAIKKNAKAKAKAKAAKAKAKRAKKASRGEARGGSPAAAKRFARAHIADKYGWGDAQMDCLIPMWDRESGWNYRASNPNGKYHGIPQTSSAVWSAQGYSRAEYMGSAAVQVKVGAKYIDARYGSPCKAWSFWKSHHWY